MLNLNDSEVLQLMTYRGSFYDTLIIATAYKKNELANWVNPLYQQVVVLNNFKFLEDYLATFPYAPEMFIEMHCKFKLDNQKNAHSHTFQKFLGYLSDQYLKYDIARDIGFEDMASEIANSNAEFHLFRRQNKE